MTQKFPISGSTWDNNVDEAVSLIKRSQSFLFCGDIDPDSVGSMLALALYLRLLKKQAYLVISEGLSDNLDYMRHILEYNSVTILQKAEDICAVREKIDTVIFCDTANTKLVPHYPVIRESILSRKLPVIEIDHHFGADSEELTSNGIKLFRKANANTEIIGELLEKLSGGREGAPQPFNHRNIVIGLITGLLGDTVGGKVVHDQESYDHWMSLLEAQLQKYTRWRESAPDRLPDNKGEKFGTTSSILAYLNKLSDEQNACLVTLKDRITVDGGLGFLNIMNSTYSQVKDVCQPYDSDGFVDILGFLMNIVPEESGKAGLVCYHGKNAERKNCIFIKLRRAVDYDGFDLRRAEDEIKKAFEDMYMGGGGHPGAVSFRIQPLDENEFLAKLEPVVTFIKSHLR